MSDWAPVVVAASAAFAETIPGVGVFLPGEAVITSVATVIDSTPRHVLGPAVLVAAWSGDQTNYWVARRGSRRFTSTHTGTEPEGTPFRRATVLLRRHGVKTVLIGRLVPFVRSFIPAAAGVARVGPVPFALASAVGCLIWTSLWLGAGRALQSLLDEPVPPWAALALSGLGVATCVVVSVLWRRHRARAGRKALTR